MYYFLKNDKGCVELKGFRCGAEGFLMWNWGVFGMELRSFGVEMRGFDVEMRGFWSWTEGFRMLKSCGPCVELRGLCGTEGYSYNNSNRILDHSTPQLNIGMDHWLKWLLIVESKFNLICFYFTEFYQN